MKALVYQAPGKISLERVEDPSPSADEVLLRVDAAGVCGTDRHIVAGELGVKPGTVPGHEIAGHDVSVGSTHSRRIDPQQDLVGGGGGILDLLQRNLARRLVDERLHLIPMKRAMMLRWIWLVPPPSSQPRTSRTRRMKWESRS